MDNDPPGAWADRLAATRPEVVGLLVVLAVAAVVLGALWRGAVAQAGRPVAPIVAAPALVGGELVVHVTGEVRTPGVVTVRDGARVADVVALVGGATPLADLGGLNLARLVVDGEQVVVPSRTPSAAAGTATEVPSAFRDDGRLDLNLATAQDLQSLSGIGPVLAERIVRHREDHGPFASAGDLRAVPGIGEKTFQAIADLVAV